MSEAWLLKRSSWVRDGLTLTSWCCCLVAPWCRTLLQRHGLYAAHQAPLSMELSRQEYWSGLPFPSPGGLPDPGITPASPSLAGRFFTPAPPGRPQGARRGRLQPRPNAASLRHWVLIYEQELKAVSGETEGWWWLLILTSTARTV